MKPAVIYEMEGGLLGCVIPSVAVVADKAPREVVAKKLKALGLDINECNAVDADTFRSAMRSAIVGNLDELNEVAATIEDDRTRADIVGRIAELQLYCQRLEQQQAELLTLSKARQAELARANDLEANRQRVDAETKAAQAKADDAARWTDIQVVQVLDGSVEMLKHFCEFAGFFGPKREPQFRRYAVKLGRWENVELVPPDVRERINKPFARSKVTIPER